MVRGEGQGNEGCVTELPWRKYISIFMSAVPRRAKSIVLANEKMGAVVPQPYHHGQSKLGLEFEFRALV
jgi:hypothetical protein